MKDVGYTSMGGKMNCSSVYVYWLVLLELIARALVDNLEELSILIGCRDETENLNNNIREYL